MNMVDSSENNSSRLIYDLSYLQDDEALKDSALIVFNSQRENHNDFLKNNFHEDKNALDKVSEESLHSALNETTKVSDIVQDRKLSNCIAYNFDNVKDAIISEKLKYLREKVD